MGDYTEDSDVLTLLALYVRVEAPREQVVLPPSSVPTLVGTTPGLSYRALLCGREVTALEIAAL